MGAIRIVLRKKLSGDGTYPLAVRITKNRKASYLYVGQNIKEKDWDSKKHEVRKSHPDSTYINNLLAKKVSEANQKLLDLEAVRDRTTSAAVKQSLRPDGGVSFFSQAEMYLDNLKKSGKYNSYVAEEPRINRFRQFLKDADIDLLDISVPLLNRYRAYLRKPKKINDKKEVTIKERTVVNHLLIIRTVYNQAIKGGVIDRKNYPFGKDLVPIKFPESVKIGLTPEEVKKVENLELPSGSFLNHSRNIWLFSFYFAGMRVSDILRLKWSDFQNDRMFYAMGKNDKAGSLKVPEKALKIIQQYQGERKINNDLVFPELKILDSLSNKYEVQRKTSYAVKRLDKHLKKLAEVAKIEKKLTMHIARHTFGNISGERIPVQMLQKLYRHSSITTTIGYQANFINKTADDALDAVINY